MNSHQKRALQAFRRVQAWLTAHPDVAGTGAPAARSAQELNAIVTQLSGAASAQDGHDRAARGAAQDTARARTELVVHQMRHLAVIAESAIPDVVKMVAALRRPVKTDNESLIAQAEAMAAAAEGYKTELVARGLAPDFVEQLRAAAQALRKAIDTRGASVASRHKAGEAIQDLVKRGIRAVETVSVLVDRKYRDDSATRAEWKQLRRVTLVGPRGVEPSVPVVNGPTPAPNGGSVVMQGAPRDVQAAAA